MMVVKYTAVILMVLALGSATPLPASPTSGQREERSPVKNLEILEGEASIPPPVLGKIQLLNVSGSVGGSSATGSSSVSGTNYITNGIRENGNFQDIPVEIILSSTESPSIPTNLEPVLSSTLDGQENGDTVTSLRSHNASSPPGEVEEPSNQNCTEVLVPGSPHHTLRCPNAQAFSNYLRKESFKRGSSIAVEIERVDGTLILPSSTELKLVSLIVRSANLVAITIQSTQPQMFQFLEKLDFSGNPDFDARSLNTILSLLPSLTHLNLRGSALASLEFQLHGMLNKMPNLQHLDIASTGLHHLRTTFAGNKQLRHLDVSGNELIWVTLSEDVVNHLRHLNMSGCGLRSIQVHEAPVRGTIPLTAYLKVPRNLRVLDVSDNLLTDLPPPLLNALVPECVVLNITNNSWSDACNKCSLYYLWQYLTTLPLHTAKCSDLHGTEDVLCFRKEEALLTCGWDICPQGCQCNRMTKTVDCSAIRLESIPPVGPSSAEILLVQNNNLQNIAGIGSPSWCNLKSLHVEHNQISKLLPPGTKGHCSCHTDEDYYSDQQTCFPQNLKKLHLDNNLLQHLSATDCPLLYPLQMLYLSRNKIRAPGAQGCGSLENLEVLNLSHNNIINVYEPALASYPHLKELILSHNGLRHLQPDVTSLMHKLRVLDLSHNSLEDISGNLGAPRTDFFNKDSGHMEKLFLNNNMLTQVAQVLSITDIPSLKMVTLDNNNWTCFCKAIEPLKVIVVRRNVALHGAIKDMICSTPSNTKGIAVNERLLECLKVPSDVKGTVLMTVIPILIFFGICVVICYSKCWGKLYAFINRRETSKTKGVRRKYDVFVVSSSTDYELLQPYVIIPLTNKGYSIAWNKNAFKLGCDITEHMDRAVRNSSRMVVFATNNFVTSTGGLRELQGGLAEESAHPNDFEIMALVTETLPLVLNPGLQNLLEIVNRPTKVLFSDRDYIKKICKFLPTPEPNKNSPDGLYTSENCPPDPRREQTRQREGCADRPAEILHTHHEQTHITINFDISCASTSQSYNSHVTGTVSEEERSRNTRSRNAQRFNVSPTAPPPASRDTISLNDYILDTQDNDDDTIFQDTCL